jgi:hypothetical protein
MSQILKSDDCVIILLSLKDFNKIYGIVNDKSYLYNSTMCIKYN